MIASVITLLLIGGGTMSVNPKEISYIVDRECFTKRLLGKSEPCREVGLKSGKEFEVTNSTQELVRAMRGTK